MERNWDMDQVSDGKRYYSNDMVKLGCQECAGCSSCCHDMGSSIVLDPYDVYRLTKASGWSFGQMLEHCLELNVVDGVILPNLKMDEEKNQCTFLNEEGTCSIHAARPGICRLFPLGRIYENGSFQYFLQIHECKKENRTKMKISKWLDTPQLKLYEDFICQWHYYLKEIQDKVVQGMEEERIKQVSMNILNEFYIRPYNTQDDFYPQFQERIETLRQ